MFFKTWISKDQKTFGDDIWLSQCGNIAILIDAISISKNPFETKKEIVSFLNDNEEMISMLPVKTIIEKLNSFLVELNNDLLASVCALVHKDNTISYVSVGNSQIIVIDNDQLNYIIEPIHQPEELLGMKLEIHVVENSFTINDATTYILASDGIKLNNFSFEKISILKTNQEWYNFAQTQQNESDWCFAVFPFEKQLSYENSQWSYFPFVGEQENYEHEKDGLSKLADILFQDSDFEGFKILGGPQIPLNNTFRKMDGILVSPYGIVLLELKDWYGDIKIPIEGLGKISAYHNNIKKEETSPIKKINESMDTFSDWNIFSDIELQEKRIGAIIFTHPLGKINCVNSVGEEIPNEYKSGYVLISNINDFPSILKKYWKKNLSRKKKRIDIETINKICNSYVNIDLSDNHSSSSISLNNGKYIFSKEDLDVESSTEYYKLYKGSDTRKNRPVWIKEYELTTISKGSLKEEATRILRETDALVDLQKSLNVQDLKSSEQIDTKLYVILEYIDGLSLEKYLDTELSQCDKLNLIKEIAKILIDLENEDIIHRAINPKNIIVKENGTPILINFELCKLDFLPTLSPRGRRLLDSAYEAREINTNTSGNITISSDIFSVGKLICFILSNKLPFKNSKEKARFARNKKNWDTLILECKLPSFAINQIKSLLSDDSMLRPSVDELLNYINQWIEELKC